MWNPHPQAYCIGIHITVNIRFSSNVVFKLLGARRDKDGYIWITGRIDDMLNVSGHLISTAEVESVLIENPVVAETAVVAHPHSVKGECLYCFITLKDVSFCLMLLCIIKNIHVCLFQDLLNATKFSVLAQISVLQNEQGFKF